MNAGGIGIGGGLLPGMGVDDGMMGDPRGGISHMGDPNAPPHGLGSGGIDGMNGLGMILQGDMMAQGDLGMGSMQQQQQPNGQSYHSSSSSSGGGYPPVSHNRCPLLTTSTASYSCHYLHSNTIPLYNTHCL